MAGEYDFMLPEDRVRKIAEFEQERKNWIATRNRGMARFVLLHECLRTVALVIALSIFPLVFRHERPALVLLAAIFVLLVQVVVNLLAWYWNERRYRNEVL